MTNRGFNEILIFVTGSTPQIVTETIYALAIKIPSIIPHKSYFITTSRGRKLIQKNLLQGNILQRLADELNISLPLIDSFIIAKDAQGTEIDDIRSESENTTIGDIITSFIREQASDSTNRLHCSLAGGRKTMSFYIGAALQLFGRSWDKLYHVLVSAEFESNSHNDGIPPEIMRTNISKIKSNIKSTLNDETLLPDYTITSIKIYGNTKYGLRIEKGKITIE